MPQLDGTGPGKQGSKTGRGLGRCSAVSKEEALEKLGKGMGLRRKSVVAKVRQNAYKAV